MDAATRDKYFAALEGPELAAATNPNQVATSSDGRIETGGCTAATQDTLGNPLDQDEQLRAHVNAAAGLHDFSASGSGFDDDAPDDPRFATALAAWSTCLEDRTGEQADSPNELARRFLDGNYDGSATDPERDVATADAECQQQAQLWTTWYTVVTELTRNQLASDASLYDQWSRHRVDMVDNARTILSDRGIEPPDLD